jgi:hypothetical protein
MIRTISFEGARKMGMKSFRAIELSGGGISNVLFISSLEGGGI